MNWKEIEILKNESGKFLVRDRQGNVERLYSEKENHSRFVREVLNKLKVKLDETKGKPYLRAILLEWIKNFPLS